MKVSNPGTVPVYTVSGASGRTLPEWISKKRKNRKGGQDDAEHVQLLQDFEFEGHSECIRISEDGDYIVSTGAYKPQMHVHDLKQLSVYLPIHRRLGRYDSDTSHSSVLLDTPRA